MNGAMMAPQMMGNSNGNMMESMKSNMMTMLMINNMAGNNGGGKSGGAGGDQNMFSMIYIFVATSVVDFVFKNAPFVFAFLMKKYTDKIENIKKDLDNTTKDLTDNKIKKKTASITVTINVNNPENIIGQSLLDFITNNKNTTHVSYVRENFILNQKDVINIDDDVFARMMQSTSADQGGQGSTSTNISSGAGSGAGQSAIVQVIEIYSFTKTTDELRLFLDNIKQKYTINVKNKLGNRRYYFNMHPLHVPMDIDKRKDMSRLPANFVFIMKHFQTNRKFSNLFGEDIDVIRGRVNFFTKNKKWYDEKGIPYTLGLLLSGSPGTGKTSTIKCLANETNRHICNINLNNDMSKTQLENLFFNENINVLNPSTGQHDTFCIPLDQRIYVLEDVDCQSDIVMERALKNDKKVDKDTTPDKQSLNPFTGGPLTNEKKGEDKNKVDLSFLLNLLDGVLENPGRIVIMTSNFPDTLDSALIRPGRIDVIAKFKNCSNKTVTDMLEFFYDIKLSEEERERLSKLLEEIVTPAELSKVMFENFSDHEASIQHMENLTIKKLKEELKKEEEEFKKAVEEKKVAEEEKKAAVEELNSLSPQLGIPDQPFSIGVTLDMTTSSPTPIYSQIPKPTTENGFTEQKGEGLTEPSLEAMVEKYSPIRRRIEEDTVFVFIDSILDQYLSIERKQQKWNDFTYYNNLLQTQLFNLKEYGTLVSECLLHHKDVVECVDNLKLQKKSLGLKYQKERYRISLYETKLRGFFRPEYMLNSGLKDRMVQDKMIVMMNDGGVLGTHINSSSFESCDNSSLNTSSYSAY